MLVEKINMKKLNYTEDLLRVIFFWIGTFFLVSGILSFLGILKPAVNSGIQNPDMLGTVFSITFKINRENEKELTYESVYIDEFDTCDSNLEDVNTDIKVQFSDKNADKNAQNKQNLQNTPEEQAGVKGQSDSINKSDSKNNETLKDTNSNSGKHESISKDINGTEENSVSLIEVNSSDTVKSTNIVIVIVIAGFLSLCLIATTVLVSTGNAFASDANVGELAVTSAQGCEGDTVKVTVSYNNNQGTSGFEFRMYYNPDVLELVKTTLSEMYLSKM